MKIYHAQCLCCGQWNYNLYLEETEGWFECEKCGRVSRLFPFKAEDLPMLTKENWHLQVPNSTAPAEELRKAV